MQQDINHRTMKGKFCQSAPRASPACFDCVSTAHACCLLALRVRLLPPPVRVPQQGRAGNERAHALQGAHQKATVRAQQSRVQFLSEQNQALGAKCKALERRRALQAEGFGSEIALLRTSIKALERRLTQVKLVARHRSEEAKLATEPEFLAVEERLQRLTEQLNQWVNGDAAAHA